jgi:hypothetical protein
VISLSALWRFLVLVLKFSGNAALILSLAVVNQTPGTLDAADPLVGEGPIRPNQAARRLRWTNG